MLNQCLENTGEGSLHACISIIAFVNSERWLAKSRVDVTQCQHGKFFSLTLYFFVLYYKKIYNIFPYGYTVITTLVEIGKTRNCVKTLRPLALWASLNLLYISTRKMLNIISSNWTLFRLCWTFLFPVGDICMVSVYMQVNGETSKHFLRGAVFSL